MAASAAADLSFPDWPASFDNTLLRDLRADTFGDPYQSREVHGAHYTRLRPNVKAPKPVLVAHSEEVAATLGMSAADVASEAFLKMFSGSPPATHECWATAYGASFAGSYGGQRGDGRAVSLGQTGEVELQLKGGGTTPFSRQVRTASAPPPHRLRTTSPPPSPHCPCMAAPCIPHPALLQFDGRAVLRSCVREFLASEAMAALRVPTTRCLCVVATGDGVVRQWYGEDGRERVLNEPGAVGTRVARSYLRFGQMELFTQRGDLPLLQALYLLWPYLLWITCCCCRHTPLHALAPLHRPPHPLAAPHTLAAAATGAGRARPTLTLTPTPTLTPTLTAAAGAGRACAHAGVRPPAAAASRRATHTLLRAHVQGGMRAAGTAHG